MSSPPRSRLSSEMTAPTRSHKIFAARRPRLGLAVRRVLMVAALARAAQFVEAILFPLVAVDRGAGTAGAAQVLLALALGTTAGSLVGGSAVDRFGTRAAATGGLGLAASGALALAAVEAVGLLAIAAALYGAATATWRLALEAATAHALAEGRLPRNDGQNDRQLRERAFGSLVWLVNMGALVSAVALAAGLDLTAAVLVQAGTMAVAALVAAGLVPRRARSAPRSALPARGWTAVPRGMWLLSLSYAPLTAVMFQGFAGLAVIFEDADYRLMVLINATTLVLFPLVLWRVVTRLDGRQALVVAGLVQGAGIAAAALLADPVFSTVIWSAGEVILISVMPSVVSGIAPHESVGHYRASFAVVQGAAAALATFGGPLLAAWSVEGFAIAVMALTVAGVLSLLARGAAVERGLRQPVACPCGALLCSCDAEHIACAVPSPIAVHAAGRL